MKPQRRYFPTKTDAESHLLAEGYSRDFADGRHPWTSRDGLISADIRYNSVGFFIEYVA